MSGEHKQSSWFKVEETAASMIRRPWKQGLEEMGKEYLT